MKIVACHRVSTARQGQSGLGLEAQTRVIEDFASARNANLIASSTEVESGKDNDRPALAKALHLAKVTSATLMIAKLNRLTAAPRFAHALSTPSETC